MKKLVFSAFIILFMGSTYAQKTIQVIDIATYQAVANVLVSKSDKSAVIGKTNEKGEIQLNFKELNYLFTHPDYLSIVYSSFCQSKHQFF